MPVLRRTPQDARLLISDTSPYGSRVLQVETDSVATAAYLRKPDGTTVAAAWLANHKQATPQPDLARLNAGRVPAMPAGFTKHPHGRPALDPGALETVWFEEGDGVAILEHGQPLCVIPGWCDMDRGLPGYSREGIGRTPFAFGLDEEFEDLNQRIKKAQAFWDWRNGEGAWEGFQASLLGHLLSKLGPGGYYWHDVGRQWRAGAGQGTGGAYPLVGVSERPARDDRAYRVLSTVGMSCQRMPTVELYEEQVGEHARIELAVATTLAGPRAGSIFPWLAQYPWRAVTSFAAGDDVKWYHEARTFPLGPAWEGVLLLDDPNRLEGPNAPDMTGFSFGGDSVRWLWLIPITEKDRQFGKTNGSDALIERLARNGRTWIVEE